MPILIPLSANQGAGDTIIVPDDPLPSQREGLAYVTFYLLRSDRALPSPAFWRAHVMLPVVITHTDGKRYMLAAGLTTNDQDAALNVGWPQPAGWAGTIAGARKFLSVNRLTAWWFIFDAWLARMPNDRRVEGDQGVSYLPEAFAGPRLYALFYYGYNGVPTPSTAGVHPKIYPDLGAFLRNGFGTDGSPDPYSHDRLIAAGVKRMFHLWLYGETFPAYQAGNTPATYPPPDNGDVVGCNPLNEVLHEAAVGRSYLNQIVPEMGTQERMGQLHEAVIYSGCVAKSSPADFFTLMKHGVIARALGATQAYDAEFVLDYSDASNPHKKFIDAQYANYGTKTIGEPWDRRGVAEMDAWFARMKGVISDVAGGRPALALSDPSTWYTPASIVAQGSRPLVLFQNSGTPAARTSAANDWWSMTPPADVVMDFGGFSTQNAEDLVALNETFLTPL